MRISIKVDVDGVRETVADVEDMKDRAEDFRPVFRSIRDELEQSWSNNFTAQGLLVGGWQPLDPQYARWKSRNYPGAPPMVKSGALFRSISNLRGSDVEIGKMSARFGTKVEYAKFHQYGTTRMPKRQIIFVPQGADARWSKKVRDYIVDGDGAFEQ